jgi:hypothetical protein
MLNNNNIEICCKLLRCLLAVCLLLQVGLFAAAWSGVLPAGAFMQVSADGISEQQMRALTGPQRGLGALIGLPALLTLCYGLLRLFRLLRMVGSGASFERATVGHLRAFAGATLAWTLLSIVEPPLRSIVLQRVLGAPRSGFAIGFQSAELMLVLVCALFFLVTNLLHEGRRLAEENAEFV